MIVELVEVEISPGFTENCYILSAHEGALDVMVVDPGAEPEKILAAVGKRRIRWIFLTHRHYDHINALRSLKEASGAEVIAHSLDAEAIGGKLTERPSVGRLNAKFTTVDRCVEAGESVDLGEVKLQVLHTPGHTIGSVCLFDAASATLISGDTLFRGTCGRIDLPTGSAKMMQESLHALYKLPDETKVYPGHDDATSIAYEKNYGALLCI